MPNHLANEKSPYLLQHAENPVEWYPWGAEALDRARREDKPILLSIGYSSCHWCHVMAHESFEDPETARLMNERFVNIKLDREERPDIDAVYMEAVQALTGHGGWPLNVFLMPDGRPFFGGTYFPPRPRPGIPAWPQVLERVSEVYGAERDDASHNAEALTAYLRQSNDLPQAEELPGIEDLRAAYRATQSQWDWTNGGFGGAPKFPQPLGLAFTLRCWQRFGDERALQFVERTLQKMADGGIFDQIGGGFHRYAVDSIWLVPHFEKMLYDNALMAQVYVQAYQATGKSLYRAVAERTLDYMLRDMLAPEGAFYSAQDADSEGVEGKFYVWRPDEVENLLGDDAAVALRYFGVTPGGNWEGATILTRAMTPGEIADQTGRPLPDVEAAIDRARLALLGARGNRIPPATDTKILTSWNALAIRALAEAGRAFDRPDYIGAAERAVHFLLSELRPGGRLVRSYREGPSPVEGFLEDYAYLVEALLALYEATSSIMYLQAAEDLAEGMLERFWEDRDRMPFDASADAGTPVVRPRSLFDNPIPSGSSAAAMGLLRLHAFTGHDRYASSATPVLRGARDHMGRMPLAFAYLLCAVDLYLASATQIAIVGEPGEADTERLARTVWERFLPNRVLAVGEGNDVELLAGRERVGGLPTAYVCHHFSCRLPVTDVKALRAQLDAAIATT